MNLIRGKYIAAVLCAALAVPVVLLSNGCTEECVDRFDCRGKGEPGDYMVCNSGKCEKGSPPVTGEDAGVDSGTPEVDSGTPEVDAGTDAGTEVDAGTDAGTETDAGTDAGTETDAGTTTDAGTDAGSRAVRVTRTVGDETLASAASRPLRPCRVQK